MVNVYIAHPIDQARDRMWSSEVDIFKKWLSEQGDVGWVYDPAGAFVVGQGQRNPGLQEINDAALMRSGLVVAWLPAGVPTIGTPMEIERAARAGIPVAVVSDASSWALQYPEDIPVRVCRFLDLGEETLAWARKAREGVSERLADLDGAPMPLTVSEGSETPRKGYENDAGFDLIVSETTVMPPGEFTDIPCGVSVQLPDAAWGLITGRSSTLRNRGLLVNQGVIDAGYRGPLFAGAWNLTSQPVVVEKGERVAQFIVHRRWNVRPVQVDRLEPSARGTQGFGSTGQ